MAVDTGGLERPQFRGSADCPGRLWTVLGVLRIRRLGFESLRACCAKPLVGPVSALVRFRWLDTVFAEGAILGSHSL
jgi:hypothetical protein